MTPSKVLIVDDESDILATVRMALQVCKDSSFIVEAYPNPFVALEKFKADPNSYGIVLTDIRMPNRNGFQFARSVRDLREDVPILFMTAFVIDENLPGFEAIWIRGIVIRKPEGLFQLCEMLKREMKKIVSSNRNSTDRAL